MQMRKFKVPNKSAFVSTDGRLDGVDPLLDLLSPKATHDDDILSHVTSDYIGPSTRHSFV